MLTSLSFTMIAAVSIIASFVVLVMVILSTYKRCSSDQILVIYGKFLGGEKAVCINGGGRIVIPFFQDYRYLSLAPRSIDVNLSAAISKNNIRVNIPSSFTIAISADNNHIRNAAERLLNADGNFIRQQAHEIIVGQLRQVIAQMTIEEINTDRDGFLNKINDNVETELNKLGLHVINVNIQDIQDDSGYIEALGKKAAAEAIEQANIDVANQRRYGAIGTQEADRDREIKVASARAEAAIGTKEAAMNEQIRTVEFETTATQKNNDSKILIAESNATLSEKEAESSRRGAVAQANAKRETFIAEKEMKAAELRRDTLAEEEVQKEVKIVQAQADAQTIIEKAKGDAEAITIRAEAEAQALLKKLTAQSDGLSKIVSACGNDANVAYQIMIMEQLPHLLQIQASAISNLKIDNLTVWDNGQGTGVQKLVSDVSTILPPLASVIKNATGVDLIGKKQESTEI